MESTRITSGVAAVRGKAASANATALVDSRKRKRGALQDISNSHTRGTNANANAKINAKINASDVTKKPLSGGVSKPLTNANVAARGVKRSANSMSQLPPTATTAVTANVRARGSRVTGVHASTAAVTKRRRENTDDSTASGKVQTRLLSFKSITTAATTKTKPAPTTIPVVKREKKEVTQETAVDCPDVEMECTETLKPETSQPEPTPTMVAAPTEEPQAETKPSVAELQAPQPAPVMAPSSRGEIPPYQPRPILFTFDHRDSGFDEETYRSQIRDIDAPFQNSAIYCVKIARDMDRFHFQHEDKYRPATDYIGTVQLDINEKMRTILIDWLVEVGEEYELDSQTFHKTVNLVDRCLATFKINRKQFQLLGCACMMIAAKFEEVYGPNVDEFVYISDQTYTSEEMLEMEAKVLQALEYRIASTTCHGFLPRFTRAGCTTDKQRFLVQYLCDFAMLYYHMLEYRPSMIAAAAIYLSRVMTSEAQPWTPTLHHFTRFNAWELKACVMDLNRLHLAECELMETQRDKAKAVSEKYVSEKFLGVSATPSVDEKVLEQSFLAYEQPLYMRRAIKQESSSPESSENEH